MWYMVVEEYSGRGGNSGRGDRRGGQGSWRWMEMRTGRQDGSMMEGEVGWEENRWRRNAK